MDVLAHACHADTVEVCESNIRESRSDLLGVAKFNAVMGEHRVADIEDDPDRQVFIFFKQADQSVSVADEYIPVEVTNVISGGIVAMIRKFNATPHLPGLALRSLSSAKKPSGDNLQ